MSEFALIDSIRGLTAQARDDVGLGIGDDAALLEVASGQQLVACTDTLVAGVHFLHGTAPTDLGWKSLAVNLSDLAAMGATPAWALLALTLPHADADFVNGFTKGFATLAREHRVALVGGDTTAGPLSITVTALGTLPTGSALTRGGAQIGDVVCVTGSLGDAAAALRLLQSRANVPDHLLAALHRPQPRIAAGQILRGVATACIDVSDGLAADLGHICTASGVGAEIDASLLPVSNALAQAFDDDTCRALALSGGDDYELCFTVPVPSVDAVLAQLAGAGCVAQRIGRIVAGGRVRVLDRTGNPIDLPRQGWEHFTP